MISSMLVWWVSSAHRLLGCNLQLAPVVNNPAGTFHHPSSHQTQTHLENNVDSFQGTLSKSSAIYISVRLKSSGLAMKVVGDKKLHCDNGW